MTDAFLERQRAAAAAAWNLDRGVVLVVAGDEIPVPGRGDRMYPFRAHSEYLYLADRERPGGVLAYAPAHGWGRVRRAGHRRRAAVDRARGRLRRSARRHAPVGRARGVGWRPAGAPARRGRR